MGVPFGRFEVLELLGRGGMAEVFKARISTGAGAGQLVALKRLLPSLSTDVDSVDLFTGEADVSRLLRHPNIVAVLETGLVGEIYYLAMELVEGNDLSHVLGQLRAKNVLMPVGFAVFIARALLSALAHAHVATGPTGIPLSVVHCDVSPSNVFVSTAGLVKLGDFGIAKARLHGDARSSWGKIAYAAPEQLEGAPLDPRADLWSVGVTLYEMLTNRRPFEGATPEDTQRLVVSQTPERVDEVRPIASGLQDALDRALERDPKRRFQSAAEFHAALRDLRTGVGVPGTDGAGLARMVAGLRA